MVSHWLIRVPFIRSSFPAVPREYKAPADQHGVWEETASCILNPAKLY